MGWPAAGSIREPSSPSAANRSQSSMVATLTGISTMPETVLASIPLVWETQLLISDSSALAPAEQPPHQESIRSAAPMTPQWLATMRWTRTPSTLLPDLAPCPPSDEILSVHPV